MKARPGFRLLALVCLAALLASCNSSTAPDFESGEQGDATFDGAVDPDGSFLLRRIEASDGRTSVAVDLIGTNLRVDPSTETVSVDVSIRNRGRIPLHAPAVIRVGDFRPRGVSVENPDFVEIPNLFPVPPPTPLPYGFDYSERFGDDGALSPGETSAAKEWIFLDPGLTPFSFAARAEFAFDPVPRPHIGGIVFHDANRNGRHDANERPVAIGAVEVRSPDGDIRAGFPRTNGRYFVEVHVPGLHRVTFFDPTDDLSVLCPTTSNPLEVVLLPGPDGGPQSFDQADFGIVRGPCEDPPPPVVMVTNRQPEDLQRDPYWMVDASLDGDLLELHVGFSGCEPHHPFRLFASRDFMESDPVQTWMVLAHDQRGELCEAAWDQVLTFDLDPIRRAHVSAYGEPGVVILRFFDFEGNLRRFEFGP